MESCATTSPSLAPPIVAVVEDAKAAVPAQTQQPSLQAAQPPTPPAKVGGAKSNSKLPFAPKAGKRNPKVNSGAGSPVKAVSDDTGVTVRATRYPVTQAFQAYWLEHGIKFVVENKGNVSHTHPNTAAERTLAEAEAFSLALMAAKRRVHSTVVEVGGNAERTRSCGYRDIDGPVHVCTSQLTTDDVCREAFVDNAICTCRFEELQTCTHRPQRGGDLIIVAIDVLYYLSPLAIANTLREGDVLFATCHRFGVNEEAGHRPSYLPSAEAETKWARSGPSVTEEVLKGGKLYTHNDLAWLRLGAFVHQHGTLAWEARGTYGDNVIYKFTQTRAKIAPGNVITQQGTGQISLDLDGRQSKLTAQYETLYTVGGFVYCRQKNDVELRIPTDLFCSLLAKMHGARSMDKFNNGSRYFFDKLMMDYKDKPNLLAHLTMNEPWILSLAALFTAQTELAANRYLRKHHSLLGEVNESYHLMEPWVDRIRSWAWSKCLAFVLALAYATATGLLYGWWWFVAVFLLLVPVASAQPMAPEPLALGSVVFVVLLILFLGGYAWLRKPRRDKVMEVYDVCWGERGVCPKLRDLDPNCKLVQNLLPSMKCKQRLVGRAFGPWNPFVSYVYPRACAHNQFLAVRNRVCVKVPPVDKLVYSLALREWEDLFAGRPGLWLLSGTTFRPGWSARVYPVDFQVWLSRFEARRAGVLLRGRDGLSSAAKEIMVKRELLLYRPSADPLPKQTEPDQAMLPLVAPRAIMVSQSAYQCKHGPLLYALTNWLVSNFGILDRDEDYDWPLIGYAGHATCEHMGMWYDACLADGFNWGVVGDSRVFDAHVRKEALALEKAILSHVADVSFLNCVDPCVLRSRDGVQAVVPAQRMTGDNDTSLGNSLVQMSKILVMLRLLPRVQGRPGPETRCRFLVMGDDVLGMFSSYQEARTFATSSVPLRMGFEDEFEVYKAEEVTFCSKRPYPVMSGGKLHHVFGPKLGRWLSKVGVDTSDGFKRSLVDSAAEWKTFADFNPIVRAYPLPYALTRAVSRDYMPIASFHTQSGAFYTWLNDVYGVPEPDARDFERYLRRLVGPVPIDHPVMMRLTLKDVGDKPCVGW